MSTNRGAKSGEKLMDRFIPCRLGENLQAKFEAVSQKYDEEIQYTQMDPRTSQLVQELGLNLGDGAGNGTNQSDNLDNLPASLPLLVHSTSVNSATATNGGGSSTNRSRGFSNIFGGISTLEQVNGFALSRQSSVNNGNNQNQPDVGNPSSGTVYPILPNTLEKDHHTSLQNYNNLLEQQIFEDEQQE